MGADQHAFFRGWNALHEAATCGNEQIVTMLLSKGAVLDARSSDGWTALSLAALCDEPEVWMLLIAKGADLRVRNNRDCSALYDYGCMASPRLDPSVVAQRVVELMAAFRAGCHPYRCSGARTRTGRSAGR